MMLPYQLVLPFKRQPNYREDSWIQDSCNQEATQWIQRWPDWPRPRIICLYGETGSGKTHLSQIWLARTRGQVLSAQQTGHSSPYTLLKDNANVLLEKADTLMDEEWLFHFYNYLQETQKYALLTAHKPPSQWGVRLPDLYSRLQTIIAIEITRPEEKALHAIMLNQFQQRGLNVKPEVVDYVLKHCERSFAAVTAWVQKLDHLAASQGRSITIPLIRNALGEDGGGIIMPQ